MPNTGLSAALFCKLQIENDLSAKQVKTLFWFVFKYLHNAMDSAIVTRQAFEQLVTAACNLEELDTALLN